MLLSVVEGFAHNILTVLTKVELAEELVIQKKDVYNECAGIISRSISELDKIEREILVNFEVEGFEPLRRVLFQELEIVREVRFKISIREKAEFLKDIDLWVEQNYEIKEENEREVLETTLSSPRYKFTCKIRVIPMGYNERGISFSFTGLYEPLKEKGDTPITALYTLVKSVINNHLTATVYLLLPRR